MSISNILKPNTLDVYLNEIHGNPVNIDGSLTINNVPVIPGDAQITQTNLGSGEGILANPGTGNSFNFKRLTNSNSSIGISNDASDVTISANGYVTFNNVDDTGVGKVFVANPGGAGTHLFLSTASSSNSGISTTSNANEITYSLSNRAGGFVRLSLNIVSPTLDRVLNPLTTGTTNGVWITGLELSITLSTGVITTTIAQKVIVDISVSFTNANASSGTPDTVTLKFETTGSVVYASTQVINTFPESRTYRLLSALSIPAGSYQYKLSHTLSGAGTIQINNNSNTRFAISTFQ